MRRRFALSACLAAVASAIAAAPAPALERVEGTFFAEYTVGFYEIDQGEIVTFANRDPFLAHGVVSDDGLGGEPLFQAPVIRRDGTRLLRGAPFLTTGAYQFHCPVHPEMISRLDVGPGGTPRPPDSSAPSAGLLPAATPLKRLLKRRRLRVSVSPSEIVDAQLRLRAGGILLASAHRTYLTTGPRTLLLRIPRAAVRALRQRVAELRGAGRRRLALRVSAALVDLAGNTGKSVEVLRLRLPASARSRPK